MNLFVKYQFDEQNYLQIRETLAELFPNADINEVVKDGEVFNIDVAETLNKIGIPLEILLPIAQMTAGIFRKSYSDEESYVIKNNSTGEYLCKSKLDSMADPDQPEVYFWGSKYAEAIIYKYNHGLTAVRIAQAFNLGNLIQLELYESSIL
ncbi:MAG: hypothetical protein Q8L07_04145 [Sediminibacterium sp.]|nr:hypothetical protein [Sediminibacterium sp.]